MGPDRDVRQPTDPTAADESPPAAAQRAEAAAPAPADGPWQPGAPDGAPVAPIDADNRSLSIAAGAPWRAPRDHPPIPAVYRLAFDVVARRLVPLLALGALMGALAGVGVAVQLDPGAAGVVVLLVLVPVGFVATALMIAVAGGSLLRPELPVGSAVGLGLRRSPHYVASAILVGLAIAGVVVAVLVPSLVALALVASASDTVAVAAAVLTIILTVIGMLAMAVVGTRLVLAWPGLILGRQPVVAGLSEAWARTAGRKTYAALAVGVPYVLYVLASSAAGMLSIVSPAAAVAVTIVTASILMPYAIAAIIAADLLLRAHDLGSTPSTDPARGPAGAAPATDEGVVATRAARRVVGGLMVVAAAATVAGWAVGIGGTVGAAGVPGTVSLGRAPGATPCVVGEPSAVFAPGETVYFGVALDREVRPGETLHAAIEQGDVTVGEVDIEVTSAGRCYSEEGGIADLPVGAYRLVFTVGDEVLAEGSFEVR